MITRVITVIEVNGVIMRNIRITTITNDVHNLFTTNHITKGL